MIKRAGSTVTFVLPADVGAVSVVGEFNGWDPLAHPLRKRSNGTRSVRIDLPTGRHAFRYLAEGGAFFDDPDAELEPNGYGGTHSLVTA